MSEGQDTYRDDKTPSGQPQLDQPTQEAPPTPATGPKGKRKRDPTEGEEKEDGRTGPDGGKTSRRTSFQQTSPSMGHAFMPINTNAPQAPTQYAYQPLHASQPQGQDMNGSSSQEAANTTLAANAINSLIPQLAPGMTYSDLQAKQEHVPIDNQFQMAPQEVHHHQQQQQQQAQPPPPPPAPARQTPNPKPQVGTEEWHRVRRDNHKEVERRRRETINEGINELAKIVPGCEKNKGSILQRAVQYIQQLKEAEATNIEKWTLEKLLTEQAIQELSANNEKLQKECERAWREAETWKKSCLQAGVTQNNANQGGSS